MFTGGNLKPRSMLVLECGSQSCTSSDHCFLTATATSDTCDTIFESLLFSNPFTIIESNHKDYIKKNLNLSHYFSWLADEILEKGILPTRTIIYCQTQCALVYSTQ